MVGKFIPEEVRVSGGGKTVSISHPNAEKTHVCFRQMR